MTKTEILFGNELESVNMPRLSKLLGVSLSTLHRWRKEPQKMPLWAVIRISKLRKLTDEQKGKLLC